MEMNQDNNPEREKEDEQPALPEPSGMEPWGENMLLPTFEEGAFTEYRAPETSTALVASILARPESFGAGRIRAAIAYLEPEFRDFGGMIQVKQATFTEAVPDKAYSVVYNVRASNSFYDPRVINWVTISEQGYRLDSPGVLSRDLLAELMNRSSQPDREAAIALRAGEQITIDRKIFKDYVAALSRPASFDFYPINAISYASFAEKLTWKIGLVYQAELPDYTVRTTGLSRSPLVIDCHRGAGDKPGYTAEVSISGWFGPLVVKNTGPAEMAIRFAPPRD